MSRKKASQKSAPNAAERADEAAKQSRRARRAAARAAKDARRAETAVSKNKRAEAKAARKAAKAQRKAAQAVAQASAAEAEAKATKPARLFGQVTDPKVAKRAVTVGKILAPALAPVLLKAATGTRRYLDERRARELGVPVSEVGAYRGPTGAIGARLTGLTDAITELGQRPSNELQTTRFVDVAQQRLRDLTATVQACATMPRPRRSEVLRAVGRELDGIDADLVAHLMAASPRT